MALLKKVIMANGLPLEYHRIAMIKSEINQQVTILIHSYLNEEARQYEKDYANGLIEGEPTFPYVDAQYYNLEYDPEMTISQAYGWIKNNLPEILVACITSGATLLGVIITQIVAYKKMQVDRIKELEESKIEAAIEKQALNDRLDSINEKLDLHNEKLDRHNGFEKRIIVLETLMEQLESK